MSVVKTTDLALGNFTLCATRKAGLDDVHIGKIGMPLGNLTNEI